VLDGVYALRLGGAVVFRRLKLDPLNKLVRVISENPGFGDDDPSQLRRLQVGGPI
jgi:hypothetical protein